MTSFSMGDTQNGGDVLMNESASSQVADDTVQMSEGVSENTAPAASEMTAKPMEHDEPPRQSLHDRIAAMQADAAAAAAAAEPMDHVDHQETGHDREGSESGSMDGGSIPPSSPGENNSMYNGSPFMPDPVSPPPAPAVDPEPERVEVQSVVVEEERVEQRKEEKQRRPPTPQTEAISPEPIEDDAPSEKKAPSDGEISDGDNGKPKTKSPPPKEDNRKTALEKLKGMRFSSASKRHFPASREPRQVRTFLYEKGAAAADDEKNATAGTGLRNRTPSPEDSRKRRHDGTRGGGVGGGVAAAPRRDQPATLAPRVEMIAVLSENEVYSMSAPDLRAWIVRAMEIEAEQTRLMRGRKAQISELESILSAEKDKLSQLVNELPPHMQNIVLPGSAPPPPFAGMPSFSQPPPFGAPPPNGFPVPLFPTSQSLAPPPHAPPTSLLGPPPSQPDFRVPPPGLPPSVPGSDSPADKPLSLFSKPPPSIEPKGFASAPTLPKSASSSSLPNLSVPPPLAPPPSLPNFNVPPPSMPAASGASAGASPAGKAPYQSSAPFIASRNFPPPGMTAPPPPVPPAAPLNIARTLTSMIASAVTGSRMNQGPEIRMTPAPPGGPNILPTVRIGLPGGGGGGGSKWSNKNKFNREYGSASPNTNKR